MSILSSYAQTSCGAPPPPSGPGGPMGSGSNSPSPGGGCPPPGGSQGSAGNDNSGTSWSIIALFPFDPNEIIAPEGYDTLHWVSVKDHMGYTINYENDPVLASAPAKNVYLFYPIQPKQDISTFRLGTFGFNGDVFTIPHNSSFYTSRLDLRDSFNVYVDVTAGIDVVRNRAFWIFESVDPLTGLSPEDPLTGFLPVKDSTIGIFADTLPVNGEGFVNFTIRPKTNSLTGDEIFADAQIVFDSNDTIPTNTEMNTIDAFPPESFISATPLSDNSVRLTFNAIDDGSGVKHFDLYVSQDSLNYNPYLINYTDSVFEFAGLLGAQYHFFTLATDNTGNREQMKSGPDLSITFQSGCSSIVVNTGNSGTGSLRDAIDCAQSGATISFATSLTGQTITLNSGEIVINKNLTIAGLGTTYLSISGDDNSRIFSLPPSYHLILKNLTLKDATSTTEGGAILAAGTLTLENILLFNNFENGIPKGITISPGALLTILGTVNIQE